MNISKIDFHNFLYLFLTLIFCSMLTITSADSQEFKYRYKAEGVILGEKVVIPKNDPPVIDSQIIPDGGNGALYSYSFSGTDPEGDALAWFWSGNTPSGLSLNSATGEITGTPDMEGVYNFQISLSDGINGSISTQFSMEILGCTTGPIGTVCEDGAIYTGKPEKRYYVYKDSEDISERSFWDAVSSCQDTGGNLPSRQESVLILSNRTQTGIAFNDGYYWLNSRPAGSSSLSYTYSKVPNTYKPIEQEIILPYYCVRN